MRVSRLFPAVLVAAGFVTDWGAGPLKAGQAGSPLVVTSPNGGETWFGGGTAIVSWSNLSLTPIPIGNLNIDLSIDGGGTWSRLVSDTPDDGSESVYVPSSPSTTCRVRVQALSGFPSDASDADFSIVSIPFPPSIHVDSPNGGETWTIGTQATVTWTYSPGMDPPPPPWPNVTIDLSADGGVTWMRLASDTPNDGSQTVTVPDTPSATCRIRVQEIGGTPSDMSDATFTIALGSIPTLTVISPNGGEIWTAGSQATVIWTGVPGSNVNIDLSTDGGTTWTTIVANTPFDGSETLSVPNSPSTTCRVRVQGIGGWPSDSSDANFTLLPSGPDSDGDGLPDSWEQQYFQNLNQTGSMDPDQDGLTNAQELALGTNPTVADSDGDGLTDGEEVNTSGTVPTNPDTDNDGMADGFEVANGFNPLVRDQDGNSTSDGQDDWDGDGTINQLDATPGSPPGQALGGSNGNCGALGVEPLILLALFALVLKRRTR